MEKLKQRLKQRNLLYIEETDSISIKAMKDGFDVTLYFSKESNEPYIVFYGDMYHEHFTNEEDAIECFMFGLSDKCRLRVEFWGEKAYQWIMEYRGQDGEWRVDSGTGSLLKPFWKKKKIMYLQNSFIGN